jgi:hypothetical protein
MVCDKYRGKNIGPQCVNSLGQGKAIVLCDWYMKNVVVILCYLFVHAIYFETLSHKYRKAIGCSWIGMSCVGYPVLLFLLFCFDVSTLIVRHHMKKSKFGTKFAILNVMEIHLQELLDHNWSDLLWFSRFLWCPSFLCEALKQLTCVNVPRKVLNGDLTLIIKPEGK